MTSNEIIFKILPILITIILGYVLYRRGFLKDDHLDGFKKIVVNVTLPAGLVTAFASIDFELKYVLVFAAVFVACLLMLLLGKAIGKLLKIKSPYFPFLLTGFEAGMIGYALYGGIYGLDRLSEFGIADVGQVLFVFLVSVPLIISMNKKDSSGFFSHSMKIAVKSPIIWAILIGLILSVSGINKLAGSLAYDSIKNILNFIAVPTPFLISLVIGSGLKFSFGSMKIETFTAVLKVALSIGFAFLILFLVLKPLGLSGLMTVPLFSMFILPGPFVIPVFMDSSNREEVGFVSNTLSIGTLLGLAGFLIISLI